MSALLPTSGAGAFAAGPGMLLGLAILAVVLLAAVGRLLRLLLDLLRQLAVLAAALALVVVLGWAALTADVDAGAEPAPGPTPTETQSPSGRVAPDTRARPVPPDGRAVPPSRDKQAATR
ncbi:MAG: hypothetical protein ACJ73E_11715 [Mycobacteriales bacterium]